MLYLILIVLFILLGLAHNAPVHTTTHRPMRRTVAQPMYHLAVSSQERKEGRASRALKWN